MYLVTLAIKPMQRVVANCCKEQSLAGSEQLLSIAKIYM
jgi:hypothetical protein